MKFTTSYTPVTMAFASMSKKELKEFYDWFMLNVPYCLEELMQLVRHTPGFDKWCPDDSPNSLDALGDWLVTKVQKRDLTSEEIEAIKSQQEKTVAISTWDLTDETKSLAVYVGMYYGAVALRNNPSLKWEQSLGSKKSADYGQPILNGVGVVPINPVRVAHSIACGFAGGSKDGGELRKAYDYWSKLMKPKL